VIARMIELGGCEYVILERREYDRLAGSRSTSHRSAAARMPALPKPDRRGLRPARQTLRAILARDIIKDRLALGWSQRELARRSGISPETLCRIESGRTTPTLATVQRIDMALRNER
jgi:ribosome-binding protein aMBF1 (putative translation factor)